MKVVKYIFLGIRSPRKCVYCTFKENINKRAYCTRFELSAENISKTLGCQLGTGKDYRKYNW